MFEAKLVVYYQSRLLAMRIHRLSRCQLYIHPFGFFAKFGKNPPVLRRSLPLVFLRSKLGRRLFSTRGQATGPRPKCQLLSPAQTKTGRNSAPRSARPLKRGCGSHQHVSALATPRKQALLAPLVLAGQLTDTVAPRTPTPIIQGTCTRTPKATRTSRKP